MRALLAVAAAGVSFAATAAAVALEAGKTDVVIAADAVDSVVWAAEEATNFLSRVLGEPVPVVTAPRAGRAALVLGVNVWSQASGLDPARYPHDSFLIKTGTGRVFIAGVDEKGDVYRRLRGGNSLECFQRGTALGLYAFLERFAGCRFYFPGELGEIVPRQDRIVVPETDLVSTPANLIRKYYPSDGEIEPEMNVSAGYNAKILNWMRLKMATTALTCCHGTIKFNFMERFAKTHPEYFAQNPDGTRCNVFTGSASSKHGQLCFSHPEVREIVYQECLKRFRAGTAFVDIMPNDGYPGCFCERCRKMAKPERGVYGRDTPIVWGYTAEVARRLKAAGVAGRVTQMAYSSYSDVPTCDLPDNVAVMVATRGPWALVDAKTMEGDITKVKDWGAKTGGSVWIWTYPHKYKETNIKGVPDVAPKAWGNYYKAMKGLIFGTFAESESDRSIYHYLNYYVFSRVMWDMDTDVDAVLDEHYRLMFGSAADEMKAFYELLEAKWTRGIAGNVMDTDVGPVMSAPTEHDLWMKVYSPTARTEMDGLLAKAAAKVASGSIEGRRIAFFRRCYFDGLAEGAAVWQAKTDAAAACRWDSASGEKISLSWYAGDKTSTDRVRTEIALRREGGDYVFTFDCEEPEMDDLAVLDREHDDPDTWKDSGVEFRICPNGDRMHYYHLVVSAKGCILDSKGYKPGRTRWVGWTDRKWESGATARVTPRADGWTTELRVPVTAFGETAKDVPIEFLRSRKLKSGKGVGYYKWCQVTPELDNYEFYGTVRLPTP